VCSDQTDQAAALPDQKIARAVKQQCSLLLGALDRHEALPSTHGLHIRW
jgi:hypothetical protein